MNMICREFVPIVNDHDYDAILDHLIVVERVINEGDGECEFCHPDLEVLVVRDGIDPNTGKPCLSRFVRNLHGPSCVKEGAR